MKEQEASTLGIWTPLSQVPMVVPLLFQKYKINEITNKLLLVLDKFMPEMRLRQFENYL